MYKNGRMYLATLLTDKFCKEFTFIILTDLPLGAHKSGFDTSENNTKLTQPIEAQICIGPVSFPIAKDAALAKDIRSGKLVFPVKSIQVGSIST